MSASGKLDYSSSGLDRPVYSSMQRGSNLASQMERSSSFRESSDNPVLASHLNAYRSNSATTQGDVVNFFQCLRFDPKVVAADHKSARQIDFKRHVNIALGVLSDDFSAGLKGKLIASPVPEEIKRVRVGLRENHVKARERVKIFHESLSVFNKFFPSVPTKKRSRPEGFSNDRSSDRSILGPGLGKVGIQGQTMASFELEQQKSEERTKTVVPNKRTRTSLMDARGSAIGRLSGVDRDKETLKLGNSTGAQGEGRTLSVTTDCWEKPRMKKRRSGIKTDISPGMGSSKPIDAYRESKQGILQRPASDSRSRSNNDPQGLRQAIANGAAGLGKSDTILQPTGLMVRNPVSRADAEHGSPYSERKERPTGSEKERVNLRAGSKPNFHDEFNSSSPTSNPKTNASVRGPRSGSGLPPKLSPVVQSTTNPSEWDILSCTNKPLAAVSNRKRTTSNRSSSPPVTQWGGQRPQKISRIARRTNLVPIVSNNDENPSEDTASDVPCNEIGFGFTKRSSDGSPPQPKKVDNASVAGLSESEESGAAEVKSKEKVKQSDEIDEKATQNVQKIPPTVLSSRKNKLVSGDDIGDGVRRQGRTGRGSASTRSLIPVGVEKLGNVGTAKQLRSARFGFDKSESRVGRPPTRKLSDRKADKRHKNAAANAPVDFLDDGHEELAAAVRAVINSVRLFPSPFWRQIDSFFRMISDADIAFLKQKGDLANASPAPMTPSSNLDGSCTVPNGYGLIEHENEIVAGELGWGHERLPEGLVPGRRDSSTIPLYKRFLAALISEEDCSSVDEERELDGYGTNMMLEVESESDGLIQMVEFGSACQSTLNGCRVIGKMTTDPSRDDLSVTLPKEINTNHYLNGVLSDHTLVPAAEFSELQYGDLGSDERIYLEAQSIGLALEAVPAISHVDGGGLAKDIYEMEEQYHEQVSKKKGVIDRLLKCALETKGLQEKEFVQHALEKLVAMAYEKYMSSRRHHTTVGKSSKMARQAALAFVKRTLERCHQSENTGKSCFDEPIFKDMFSSGLAQLAEASIDGEGVQAYANASGSLEAKVSASMGLHRSSSLASRLGYTADGCVNSSDLLPPMHEQTPGRDDMWSDRIRKRELLLDDVGGPSTIGNSLTSSMKGKRSERDREGKGQFRESSSRSGTNKIGRPALANAKGERKPKAKPKQKTTQLSASLNGPFGKIAEQRKSSLAKPGETRVNSDVKEKNEFGLDAFDDSALDLSHLQIPDGLGGPDDFDSHAQDLSTWLNIDEDAYEDTDLMGLQIPMDDLSDLNMMV